MKVKYWLCFGVLCLAGAVSAQELSIPRFVSFRRADVNLRTGPGNRYPIKFVYRMKNYPVEVIDEYELWRQIREVDGTVGWVHRRMLSSGRYRRFKRPVCPVCSKLGFGARAPAVC